MNIDQALINYFWDYGDTLEGLLFVNDRPGDKIARINVVPCDDNGNMEVIEFYQGEELLTAIEMEELINIYVGMNYINENNFNNPIPYSHKVIFDLRGYNDMRLFIDLDFERINK